MRRGSGLDNADDYAAERFEGAGGNDPGGVQLGPIRVRKVRYSAGYLADHWCSKGHVLLVLDGELPTELQDGSSVVLASGMSYHVADDLMPHRSRTAGGASLFIVD